ncbi:MAG: hypothetical protein WCK02_05340 [Bacteroidota bacterium]
MTNNTTEKNKFDSSNIIHLMYQWRKPLGIIVVAAIVCSIFFSSPWFIKPKYTSSVIVFPTSNASISKALLGKIPTGKDDILAFGEEEEAEQLLQILNSDEIKNRIVKKFDLFNHYDIDSTSELKNTKLSREYENNINFRRTEFLSVEIKVSDTDPQTAADIANEISNLIDSVKTGMLKQRARTGLAIVEREFNSLEHEISGLEDSMKIIRSRGVYEYEKQAEVISEQLAIALSKNNKEAVKALQSKLDTLAKYGGAYVSLRDKVIYYREKSSDLKVKYQEAKVDAENDLPQKFLVNSAVKAEKKSYPIRWLIVLLSSFSAFIVGFLVLIINEKIKSNDSFLYYKSK